MLRLIPSIQSLLLKKKKENTSDNHICLVFMVNAIPLPPSHTLPLLILLTAKVPSVHSLIISRSISMSYQSYTVRLVCSLLTTFSPAFSTPNHHFPSAFSPWCFTPVRLFLSLIFLSSGWSVNQMSLFSACFLSI